jgi:TolB-like protein
MNTGTIENAQETSFLPEILNVSPNHFVHDGRAAEKPEAPSVADSPQNHGLFHFVAELRRRRVCRAITMYAVAMWLVCQIVELVSPQLGLPEWTLTMVIVFGLLGFPIALVLSWLFEITPNGLVIESADGSNHSATIETEPRRPLDQIIDCSLLLAALVIAAQLAVGVLTTETNAAQSYSQKIAVLPFRIASGNEAGTLSQGLVIELQHELASKTHITVIAPRDPYLTTGCLSLTGAVAVGENHIRITAMIIDNDTDVVTWSQVFEQPRADSLMASVEFAQEIVAALPSQFQISSAPEVDHAI